jgi:hypothetical protein
MSARFYWVACAMMFFISLLDLAPTTYATPTALEPAAFQTAVIHPCSWGDEAPDSPILLQSPFASGTSVVPGGLGYFYGDGDHSDQFHDYYATDWSAKADGTSTNGMAVYAIAEGDINFIGWTPIGYTVIINHPQNVQTSYGHLVDGSAASLHERQHVTTATQIGIVGNTVGAGGSTTGPHLHLRFRVGGDSLRGRTARPSPMDGQKLCDGQPIHAASKQSNNCPGPLLGSPGDSEIATSQNITFSWNPPSGCTFSGYTFRVKDTSNMDAGGVTIFDEGQGGTSVTKSFGTEWHNRDLYWGVRTANPLSPNWSVRRFRIQPGGATSCSPSADQVALYVDAGYSGGCVTLGNGNYADSGALNIANDAVSSVRIGGNVQLTLCRDSSYAGGCETFTGDDDNLSDNQIGNDQVSSARVEQRVTACPSPSTTAPSDGSVSSNQSITFSWNAPGGCTFSGYTFRVKDTPNMDAGGVTIFDEGQGGTSVTKSFGTEWHNRDLYWGVRTANPLSPNWSVRRFRIQPNQDCPAPALNSPSDGAVSTSPAVTFNWNAPGGCIFSGYTFRIKDTPNMDFGGTVIVDEGQGGTSVTKSFGAEWHNRDLYWGVRTANPLSPNWSVRRLRIEPVNTTETDPQALSSGQRIDARIDPADEDDTYTFHASAGQIATVLMEKTDSSNLDSFLELFGPGGVVGYDDDSGGNYNSRMVKTISQDGDYRILAHSYARSSSGNYRLSFDLAALTNADGDDGRWVSYGDTIQGAISPNTDRDTYYFNTVAGRAISLRMNKVAAGLDSFLELYDPNGVKLIENDDSGGQFNAWIVTNATIGGTYRVVSRSYAGSSGGSYTLHLEALSGGNLARGKPTFASSVEGSNINLSPEKATDGAAGTRWSSAFRDGQWIYVDLGQDRSINQVLLRWETAYADQYDIYVMSSTDCSSCWRRVYSTNSGDGNIDTITFNPTAARYVMIWGRHRYAYYGWQQYGFSLWEFEVYNTLSALIPTVPPDSSDKPDEGLAPLVPLPPDSQDKDATALGPGANQENMPSASPDTAESAPDINLGETYGPPIAAIEISTASVIAGRDSITLMATNAHDSDEQGDGIVAYRWISNVDGFLGNTATVTLPASLLTPGTHVITLEVQDNEGVWSVPVQATVDMQSGQRIYLPLTVR